MRIVSTIFIISAIFGLSESAFGFQAASSRSDFLRTSAAAAAGWMVAGTPGFVNVPSARASDSIRSEKLIGISDDLLLQMVKKDIVDNQYLCNGKLTRSIYDESATFTDEIDTYQLDQWIKGTQKLFVEENSQVRLVGDIDVTKSAVEFRFDEDLQFRIPLLFPTVSLTGKVVLKRDPATGLITSYQEFWDQDVSTVLKSAKFNFKL